MCGAPLAAGREVREERKVVTVLFCDLVGSTPRAEGLDPEDVRALLSRYQSLVRVELERHGGTVEKFIGDAVMPCSPTWEARLRLRAAEELIETGRRSEGGAQLEKALGFYRSAGPTFYISRGEQLLKTA